MFINYDNFDRELLKTYLCIKFSHNSQDNNIYNIFSYLDKIIINFHQPIPKNYEQNKYIMSNRLEQLYYYNYNNKLYNYNIEIYVNSDTYF